MTLSITPDKSCHHLYTFLLQKSGKLHEVEEISSRRDVELGKQRDSPVLTHQCEGKKKRKAL